MAEREPAVSLPRDLPSKQLSFKQAIDLSYETNRDVWSCTYDVVTLQQTTAAKRIQRCYKRYRAWRRAGERRDALATRRMSNVDKMGRFWLLIFNMVGIMASTLTAVCLWYFIISPDEGVSTGTNWLLLWVQVLFGCLCAFGLYAASPKRLNALRLYSFLILLCCAAQLALTGMFVLDSSEATKRMQINTYDSLATQTCTVATVASGNNEDAGSSWSQGTNGGAADASWSQSRWPDSVVELCTCVDTCDAVSAGNGDASWITEEDDPARACRAACMKDWAVSGDRAALLSGVFCLLLVLQVFTANRAWKFMGVPNNNPGTDGELGDMKLWLQAQNLDAFTKRFMVLGVRTKSNIIHMKFEAVKSVGMSAPDMKRFLVAQADAKVQALESRDNLGLSGWDKMHFGLHSVDVSEELACNIKVMTEAWYYELSVLASVGLCMWVLAQQCPAFPPADDTATLLRSVEIFVTLFYTLELSLELVVVMASQARTAEYFRNPWHITDFFCLGCFWTYLSYPVLLSFIPTDAADYLHVPKLCPAWISVGRAGRVVRPVRTLRLLGDVSLVAAVIGSSIHLFRDAILLAMFMLLLFSMIGISCFAGALHYTCVACQDSGTLDGCSESSKLVFDQHEWGLLEASDLGLEAWTNITDLMACPKALACASAEHLSSPIACVPRLEPLGVGEDEYGTRSFDNIWQAFYTMFIHMSGDNGMQDLANAFYDVDASNLWIAWPLSAISCFVLTYVALNLILAICCSVFYDIHTALEDAKEQRRQATDIRNKLKVFENSTEPTESATWDDKLDHTLASVGHAAGDILDSASRIFQSNPLGNLDDDREEQANHLQEVKKAGGIRAFVASVVDTTAFELVIVVLVAAFSMVIMLQEATNPIVTIDGLRWAESGILLCFVVEIALQLVGHGTRFFKYGENRMDLFILMLSLVGHVGTRMLAEIKSTSSLCAGSMCAGDRGETDVLRFIKFFRIMQMTRMTYKLTMMRSVLLLVFKSGASVIYLLVFVVFVLAMFSVCGMHIIGGGCNPDVVSEVPDDCEYPGANFETFTTGFLTSFQIMTGEDWSEVMFWYVTYGPMKEYSAIFFMGMWLIVYGIIFSLFVAVLLLNFGMDEDEKLPAQKIAHDTNEAENVRGKHRWSIAAIFAESQQSQQNEQKSSGSLLGIAAMDYDLVQELQQQAVETSESERKDRSLRSCCVFPLDNSMRLFCAQVESHPYFERAIVFVVLMSCLALVLEGPSCDLSGAANNETSSTVCVAQEYELVFALLQILVLVFLYLEMVLKAVSRGFFLRSARNNVQPYLVENRLDFIIIIVCTTTYFLESDTATRLARSMTPLATLVRIPSVAKILGPFSQALPMIGVVSLPILFLMAMLSIVGVDLFGDGQMMRCLDKDNGLSFLDEDLPYNQSQCGHKSTTVWKNPPWSFDNAVDGMISLCKAASVGVMPIQNVAQTIEGPGLAPKEPSIDESGTVSDTYDAEQVFTFFLMNLFIGVMSKSFSEGTGSLLVTSLQNRWTQCNEAVLDKFVCHENEFDESRPRLGTPFYNERRVAFQLAASRHFHRLTTFVIVLNCAMLMSDGYPVDPEWAAKVEIIDLGFVLFYCCEMLVKMLGFGLRNYFQSGWNCFDFVLVSTSVGALFMGTDSGISCLRVLRSFRLFLLMHQLPGLTGLIDTVAHCLRPATDIAILMFMEYFLFAIVAMRTFGQASTNHQYYSPKCNFLTFTSSMKLLFQVMCGQNYLWITADLVQEGFSEYMCFLFFFSFYIINVLILLNLFAIVVLDTFDSKCPVAQTIDTADLWCFTCAWADQTIGAGACLSLQKGHAAKILRRLDSGGAEDEASDDSPKKGMTALAAKRKRESFRPKGVVEVELVKASLAKHSLSSSDMPSKIFIAVFSGPHGRRHPQHSIHYNFKHHHALLDDVFKLCVDQREREVVFELRGDNDEKLGQAKISVLEIAASASGEFGVEIDLDLFQENGEELPQSPSSVDSAPTPRSPDAGSIIGTLTISIIFRPGLSLPLHDFMNDYHSNSRYKERGCGIEGWVWKHSGDHVSASRWKRHWMWIEHMDPPSLCYYLDAESEYALDMKGKEGKLQIYRIPAADVGEISESLHAAHCKHNWASHSDEIFHECEFQFSQQEEPEADASEDAKGNPTHQFRALVPSQRKAWCTALRWLARGCDGPRTGKIPAAPLCDRDIERIQNDPSLCPVPLCRIRLLLNHLSQADSLCGIQMTRAHLLFTCYNLEVHALQRYRKETHLEAHAAHSRLGHNLFELRGLDFRRTLRRLCLIHYGKNVSLPYAMQVEEYHHDLHKIALDIITCAVSAWVFGKVLPNRHAEKHGDEVSRRYAFILDRQHPKCDIWQARMNAYRIAVVGAGNLRLQSLFILFKYVRHQQPPLMAEAERLAREEQARRKALTVQERAAEDTKKVHNMDREVVAPARGDEPAGRVKVINPFMLATTTNEAHEA